MVRDVHGFYQIDVLVDHAAGSEVLLIDHGHMLGLGGRLSLVGPDGLEKSGDSPVKANPESPDPCEQFYDSDFLHLEPKDTQFFWPIQILLQGQVPA